ncbi:MAG: 1,4-alpha-glucan branching protein GlgB [Candidatus Omnitrophica bacterium]|nr:1,4-alpha-glucan branching protein GlgB [Candidatus Omnitrophota bacterium]
MAVKKTEKNKKKQKKKPEVSLEVQDVQLNDPRINDYDIHLFKQGNHFHLYDKLGSHKIKQDGKEGVLFAVWAPNAKSVSVIGDFNGWDKKANFLNARWDSSGIWEGFIPDVIEGALYKYHIESSCNEYVVDKSDPYAFCLELSPKTASRVWSLDYEWQDSDWMKKRQEKNKLEAPLSIYEMHLGSWKRPEGNAESFLSYREIAPLLAEYMHHMGYTHVEFLPVMEHPFYGSWGYQVVGYFAPTSRYGTPQDFMYLVDYLHQHNIGVILDWVPSHFPTDEHGLAFFDGTHLYEHQDPRKGFHPDWKSDIFNYGRSEVKNFLISNALFWFDKYHIDGLRVDAVASMLYLDYSRKPGEWIPNNFGGRENIEAIQFLKQCNEVIYQNFPDVQTIAEESTSWPMVSRPSHLGGLGFGFKWNMGWMHDSLDYFSRETIHRKYHHSQLTFSIWYAFYENFVLAISHDEVVHGKGSLLRKMPGDNWQKMANLRLLFGYMYTHPGKKLMFMGCEFGQWNEWNHDTHLDWNLLDIPEHKELLSWVRDINHLYKNEKALHELDSNLAGFEWIDCNDFERSVVIYLRKAKTSGDIILVACNFTPEPRTNYRVGVPSGGFWKEVLNSDAKQYGGSGYGNLTGCESAPVAAHGRYHSLSLTLPPLGIVVFKKEGLKVSADG